VTVDSPTLPRNSLAKPGPRRAAPGEAHHGRSRPWWPWVKRALTALFFVVVVVLLVRYGRNVDWDDVLDSVRNTPGPALLAAIALAAASHLLYSCFDLIGRRYTGHRLSKRVVMLVNFISYAFNLSMGSLVGGVAFRYRLYSRFGLRPGVITRNRLAQHATSWLGYMLLAVCFCCTRSSCRRAGRWAIPACNGWALPSFWSRRLTLACAQAGLECQATSWRSFGAHGRAAAGVRLERWRVWFLLLQQKWHSDINTVRVGAVAGVVTVPPGWASWNSFMSRCCRTRCQVADRRPAGYGPFIINPLLAALYLMRRFTPGNTGTCENATERPWPPSAPARGATEMEAQLASETDLTGFREEARVLLGQQVPPEAVHWRTGQAQNSDTFADPALPGAGRPRDVPKAASAIVPASFLRLCEVVVLHHNPERFALLYRLLWRLVHEPGLRNDPVDPDMLQATRWPRRCSAACTR
jgi:hypothetical protein